MNTLFSNTLYYQHTYIDAAGCLDEIKYFHWRDYERAFPNNTEFPWKKWRRPQEQVVFLISANIIRSQNRRK